MTDNSKKKPVYSTISIIVGISLIYLNLVISTKFHQNQHTNKPRLGNLLSFQPLLIVFKITEFLFPKLYFEYNIRNLFSKNQVLFFIMTSINLIYKD